MDNVTINGIEYAPVEKGNRAVVVVDRGWIFAGDPHQEYSAIVHDAIIIADAVLRRERESRE